jgi:hypothetical protein
LQQTKQQEEPNLIQPIMQDKIYKLQQASDIFKIITFRSHRYVKVINRETM